MSLPNKKKTKKSLPFSSSLFGRSSPPFFLQANYSDNSCVFCFVFCLFFFFSLLFLRWRETSLPHHQLKTLFLYSSVCDTDTMKKNCQECLPHKEKKRARSLLFLNYRAQFQDGYLFRNTTGPGRRETAVPV